MAKAKVRSGNSSRLKTLLGLLFFIILIGLAALSWELTRSFDFSWEQANSVEAREAQRKITLLTNSIGTGKKGFIRLSQIEINSYLAGVRTNAPVDGRLTLNEVKVDLSQTNLTLISFAELNVIRWTIPFALQRQFRVTQDGTNQWALPLEEVRIGDVKLPRQLWPYLAQFVQRLDQPLGPQLAWTTNLPSVRIAKNETSRDPELRLYTYKPVLLD